ncbi:MAG: hypothetical protein E6K56_05650 [Ignavibacteria bacterium]|nr:MAG: hypothetical protein E6K56_05650 [Ignavibacteria bacterium]
MIEERYITLIHREVDGLNSAEESSDLRSYLSHDAGASDYYRDILKLSNMLGAVPLVEPPLNLKKRILNSIAVHLPSRRQNLVSAMAAQFVQSLRIHKSYAFVFASGLAIGIIGFSLLDGGSPPNQRESISHISGTMTRPGPFPALMFYDQGDLGAADVRGQVTLRGSRDLLLVELQVKGGRDVDVALDFAQDDVGFSSFSQQNPEPDNLRMEPNSVRVGNAGENQYTLIFSRKSHNVVPVKVSFYRFSKLLSDRVFSAAAVSE